MEYTVISHLTVCGAVKGETLTLKDLLRAGTNIDALITAGHIEVKAIPIKPSQEGVNK